LNFKFFSNHKYKESERLEKAATQVTIIRDNWGIPHVYGKTDADAVLACYTHNVKMISCALK
jgi:acyl-homoserine lactone acylase PvdQ